MEVLVIACFLVPAAVGAVTAVFAKRLPARVRAGWLNAMIWGGSAALAVEHVAHGELVPWPPFLTAMYSPAAAAVMLHELAAVGVPMTIALVLAWAALVVAYDKLAVFKRAPELGKYRLGFLALMLLGAFVMVLTDHTMAWLNGGPFIEYGTNGLITNSLALGVAMQPSAGGLSPVLLGLAMLIPILLIWLAALRLAPAGRLCAE